MRRLARSLAALAFGLLPAAALRAHDFWIEPSAFAPLPGQRIAVRLRVGQGFHGDPVPRDPALIQRFDTVGDSGASPVAGLAGREPAGYAAFATPGLYWIVYGSTPSQVELSAAKFETYLAEEGLESIHALRAKRGQTGTDVKERFSRCAKAAVAVSGGGPGFDTVLGLTLELIPEADPTKLKPGGELPLRLLFRGKPLAGALVVALPRDQPQSKVSARSDAKGRVRLRFDRTGPWLVKAVHMIPAPAGSAADWESFWASVTFESAKP
jgi:uncharacterized GH25 family protein